MARMVQVFSVALVACSQPHDPELVEVRSDDCSTCHEAEFLAAMEPPHQGVFPDECALCHTSESWSPAIFDHESVRNRQCLLCHQADYDQTSDPVHPGAFPTRCEDCHATTSWRPALEGEHPETAFNINDGPHSEFACLECHDINRGPSTEGANTDCIGCHTGEHRMSRVNDQHHEVRDYAFEPEMPNFCLRCHPNGRE